MKVLLISVRADHGGGPRHLEMLLDGLGANVACFVACPNEPPYQSRFERLVCGPVFKLPHRRFRIGAAVALIEFVRRQGIELIHAHGKGAGAYARIVSAATCVPCIHTPHGVHVGEYGVLKLAMYRAYENLSSRWVDGIIYVSRDESEVAARFGLWQRCRTWIIPNGVRSKPVGVEESRRRAARKALGLCEGAFVVASVSRFNYQKNMDEAFSIARLLPGMVFAWLGDGPDHDALKALAREEGANNILFLGLSESSDEVLGAADAYLATSRWEGLPLAVLEAMAMGIPIVVSDVVGHRQIVDGYGVGLSYALGDCRQAARLLAALQGDPARRRELGTHARQVQQSEFSVAKMCDSVLSVYRTVLEGRSR